MRTLTTVLIGLGAIAGTTGITGAATAEDLKIALIYGKTGPLEAYAKQTETGLRLGLEYATKGTMTVDGRKIVVIAKDDQSKPDVAKTAARRGLRGRQGRHRDRHDARRPRRSPMLPVAEEHKKILIVEPAVADQITGEKWNRYIFRTGRNSSQDAISNAVAIGKPGVTVATLAQDYAFGRDGVAAFKAALAKTGAKLAAEEYAPTNDHRLHRAGAAPVRRAEGQAGPQDHLGDLGRRRQPLTKLQDMDPEPLRHRALDRRQHPAGDGRLQGAARHGRRDLLLLRHPEEPGERLAGRRAPEALQRAAGLLHRRRLRRRDGGGRRRVKKAKSHRHREADRRDGRHGVRHAEGQDDLPQGGPSGAADHVSLQDQGRSERRLGRSPSWCASSRSRT